jgi:hypothetical protein
MWNVICRSCIGTMLAVTGLVLTPARVQTQSHTPVAVLTQNLGFNGGTTGTLNTTGANLLVACVSYYANVTPPQISDSKGNSWTLAVDATGAQDSHLQLFYSVPSNVGSSHTFTVTGNGSMSSINLMAFAGVAASPLDKVAEAFASGTSVQPGSVTPTQDDELLISCLTNTDASDTNRSIDGGFTISGQIGWDGTTYSNAVAGAYRVQTAAAAANPTWSYPGSSNTNAVIATFRTTEEEGGGGGELAEMPLFQSTDMGTRSGGFRGPNISEYSGNGLSFYDNTLFFEAGTGDSQSYFVRIDIPVPIDTGTITNMNRATVLNAGLVDPTNGNIDGLNDPFDANQPGKMRLGGLFAYDSKLYGSASIVYDAQNNQSVSHYRRNLDLDVSTGFEGWFTFGSASMSRFFSGHFASIPAYAQTALGGKVLSLGSGGLSIIGSTSAGPSAASFDPDDFAGKSHMDVVPANPLLYYTVANPFEDNLHQDCQLAGPHANCPDDPSDYWNQATQLGGAFIPEGYRSLIYFGLHGTGDYCYGTGTSNPALHGSQVGDGSHYCYDPISTAKGGHASGWRFQAYAYDLLDLAAVKAGTAQPWSLRPYATWELDIPNTYQTTITGNNWNAGSGVAYDPATRRIFFSQAGADPQQYSNHPVIWQWIHTASPQ